MLSQALYWTPRTGADGWFYKKREMWEDEIGLTRTEQESARRRLRAAGYLLEELRGHPAKLFFRVDTVKLSADLLALVNGKSFSRLKTCKQGETKPVGRNPASKKLASKLAGNPPTDGAKPADKLEGNLPTNIETKTTTETKTETTAVTGTASVAGTVVVPIRVTALSGRQIELPGDMGYPRDPQTKSFRPWCAYAVGYQKRYGVWPSWNAKQAKHCADLVTRIGEELAPRAVSAYLSEQGDRLVVQRSHPLDLLVKDCETWAARVQGALQARNEQQVRAVVNAQSAGDSVAQALEMRRARRAG